MLSSSDPLQTTFSILKSRRAREIDLPEIEEALWAAYHRQDRSAVMQKLVQRHLHLRRNRARHDRVR